MCSMSVTVKGSISALCTDGEITSVFHDGALYVMNISHDPGPTYTYD